MKKLLNQLIKKDIFLHHDKVLVAVSGGLDSMTLLQFLFHHANVLNITLGVVHVHHHQRVEADQEANDLQALAESLHLPFYLGHFTGKFSEHAARTFRYNYFKEIMSREGYTALVTAHHADDQAETVLMRLIQGRHARSLVGIKEVQPFGKGELIRPLLSLRKSDFPSIYHFEDQTNKELTYLRNRVRNQYLPQLREENPKIDESLIRLSEDLKRQYDLLTELTQSFDVTDLKKFKTYSESLKYYLLEQYFQSYPSLQVNHNQLSEILMILDNKANADYYIRKGYYLIKRYDTFKIEKISPRTDSQEKSKMINYGNRVNYSNYLVDYNPDGNGTPIYLSTLDPVCFRERKDGDRIILNGINKKISRIFIDDKIPVDIRRKAIIVEQNNEIQAIILQNRIYLRNKIKDDIMKGILYIQKLEN